MLSHISYRIHFIRFSTRNVSSDEGRSHFRALSLLFHLSVLRFSDPVVQSEAALYDFKIQPNSTDENDAFVCFQLQLDGHPACVSPIDVGQMIVTHLVKQVSQFLQHDQITTAVIAVPADFNAVQRHATIKAFEKAGLRVARVLDEPTAAAVAYGLHQDPNVTYVLVYDFGGGTLDVSLLYIREGSVQVMGSAGDNRLGGEDIDQRIAEYLRKEFEAQLGQPIVSTDVADGTSDVFPCTSAGIRRAAEQVKRELSSTEFATAECVVHESTAKLERNTRLSVSLTRDAFERLCEEILTRSLIPIRRVLDDNMMDPESVDEVVLVGGSSRIPWVHRKLKEMFNGRDPHSHIDPDVAVAYGAARIVD